MNLAFSLDSGRFNRGFDNRGLDGGPRFRLGAIGATADEESARKENDPESGRTAFENHVAFPSFLVAATLAVNVLGNRRRSLHRAVIRLVRRHAPPAVET